MPRRRFSPARLLRIALAGVLLGAAVLTVVTIAVGLFLSAPARAVIGAAPPDLEVENVAFPSLSGATLRGWFLAGRPGGGTVVLMHGVGSDRRSMTQRARLLNAWGFAVLWFDFQAHGESTGSRITFGHLEALDAEAAVGFARVRLPHERIGVIGASMGGAATLLGPRPLLVEALVLESVYPDIRTAVANRIRVVLGSAGFVADPLAGFFDLVLPPVLGLDPADLRPIDHIADATAPILMASGRRDTRTTLEDSIALFGRAPLPKDLWMVAGADHVDLEAFAPDEYARRVLPFLVEHLQTKR
jgi:fermentation-respiration switch protein FrsA (DUF1100 family)